MKFPLPATTFPTLVLSRDDERKLEDAAETVVKKTVTQYHEHLTVHNGVVDESRWKKIKTRDDLRVYRERRPSFDDNASVSSESSGDSTCDSNSGANAEFKVLMPMLTFGTIQGNLDDVMYGVLNPSSEAMQLKSAYIEDGFVDWALLAPIIKPSKQNPFRELSVKWTVKGHPGIAGAILRARDTLYIESIGYAMTPSGERIGYHLQHSVDVPEIRELLDFQIVRVKVSFCHLFRQRKENCVEVFIRGVICPMGDAPISLMAITCAEVVLSVWKNLHCADMKRLTRILIASQRSTPLSSNSNSSSISSISSGSEAGSLASSGNSVTLDRGSSSVVPVNTSTCALCCQSLGGGLSSFSSSSKEKHCRICCLRVCSRCRVYKNVHLPTRVEKELSNSSMAFCTRCVLSATSASSATFAELDALEAEDKSVDYHEALMK